MLSVSSENSAGQASAYLKTWIKIGLAGNDPEYPNETQAGEFKETMISLYELYLKGGTEAFRKGWGDIRRFRPELEQYDPETVSTPTKPDDDMIAIELVKEIRDETAFFHSQWKQYLSGVWRGQESYEFRSRIRRELRRWRWRGVAVTQNRIRALASMLEDDLYISDQTIMRQQAEQAKYINLRNGLFNLETMEFEPKHRPELFFTTQLDFDYDPHATCNSFRQYLNSSLVLPTNKNERDESLIKLLLEILGYCFTARTDLKASFWLYGGKDSGKSTFVTLLKSLMGDLYTTIDLTQLGTNRFLLAGMVGKRVVGFAEGEANTVLPDALYKTLTGGSDEIFADVKNKNPIVFRMEAKIVWAMNNLPRISDRTGATTRRVRIIPYNRTIPEAERISNLEFRLMNERPGIFNLAMDYLAELTKRGSFTLCEQAEQVKREYIYQNDTEAGFVAEECDIGESYKVRGSELYEAYKFWCERFGFHAKNMNQVALDWKRQGFVQKTSNGSWWIGLKLKSMNPSESAK